MNISVTIFFFLFCIFLNVSGQIPDVKQGGEKKLHRAPKGSMLWIKCHGQRGNSPQQMWEKCFSKRRNLHLIFSGDQSRSNAMHIRSIGNNGNAVHAFLNDYRLSGGAIRIYRFLPKEDEIQVITYNTEEKRLILETPEVQRRDEHFFRISINM